MEKRKRAELILKKVIKKITPEKQELKEIDRILKDFLQKFEKNLKKLRIDAEIFVGGSFAKGTVIKKNNYDLDIFIRFTKKELSDEKISSLTEKILKQTTENFQKIHGSRDYFSIKMREDLYLEIIPVIKVNKPKESNNITDLSYSHVKYVRKKVKKNMLDDIRLAKAFCYANNCYGAESYIRGLSGYAIELIIYYYKNFFNFAKSMVQSKDKVIIDIEKFYKKNEVMMNLNSSKIESPIILIDPTFKERNVAAALSYETFEKLKKACTEFLKNPSEKFFEKKKIDFEQMEKNALNKKYEYAIIEIKTDRQEGDIAGSKLLKFYNHFKEETGKVFDIKNSGFEYDNEQKAKFFISAVKKKEIIFNGPYLKQKENVMKFKKEHSKNFSMKNGRIYAKEKINYSLNEFISKWKDKNSKKIREMDITGLIQ